jgi:hypothetical protein
MAVAKAILNVESAGFPVIFNAYGVFFEAATLVAISKSLDRRIRNCGGYASIRAIFHWYSAHNRIYHGSLLFGRTVDQLGNLRDPSIPWGYLYNLAVRHLDATPGPSANASEFQSVLELARDMAAVFDVERYTIYEGMHGISHSGFHNAIAERVLYDELFVCFSAVAA